MKRAREYSSQIIKDTQVNMPSKLKAEISTKMRLAARIADLLEAKGMSKGEFAERAGKSPSEISKWLSGTHNFTVDTLTEIALTLKVNVADLFALDQYKTINQIKIIAESRAERSGIRFLTPVPGPYQVTR